MRRRCVAIALVLVAGPSARADGPIVVCAGLGVTKDLDLDGSAGVRGASPTGPGFHLDLGYRFIEHFAAGIHVGVARNSLTLGEAPLYHEVYTPIQLGVSAQSSVSRFWLAPWLGVNDGANFDGDRSFAFGVGGGVDVYIAPSGHRVGAYFDASYAQPAHVFAESHRYVSAGIAYRYW